MPHARFACEYVELSSDSAVLLGSSIPPSSQRVRKLRSPPQFSSVAIVAPVVHPSGRVNVFEHRLPMESMNWDLSSDGDVASGAANGWSLDPSDSSSSSTSVSDRVEPAPKRPRGRPRNEALVPVAAVADPVHDSLVPHLVAPTPWSQLARHIGSLFFRDCAGILSKAVLPAWSTRGSMVQQVCC
jgi:hypothetical protein